MPSTWRKRKSPRRSISGSRCHRRARIHHQGRSSQARSFVDRARVVRRPHPLHGYRRPCRSTWTRSRLCASPSSSLIVVTRNPGKPRIHVQSRCDPTRPPLLVAHQERTTPGGPVPRGIALYVQAAEQIAHPKSRPRRWPGITSNRCTQIGEQPSFHTPANNICPRKQQSRTRY